MYAAMLKPPNSVYSKVGGVCSEILDGAVYDHLGTQSGRSKAAAANHALTYEGRTDGNPSCRPGAAKRIRPGPARKP
jgi:hypothetical protein